MKQFAQTLAVFIALRKEHNKGAGDSVQLSIFSDCSGGVSADEIELFRFADGDELEQKLKQEIGELAVKAKIKTLGIE